MRISRDEWGLRIAETTALRGTCQRRQVGCFLTDAWGRELAMGYNGVAYGLPHCREGNACAGAAYTTGEGLDLCEAIHAEQNALLKCQSPYTILTCYVTVSPCIPCVKMLMNTSCRRIVFREPYAHEAPSRELWLRTPGAEWLKK